MALAEVIHADEVPALIPDGATLGVSGILLSGFAEEVAIAVEQSFLEKGHPRGLTLVHGSGIGNAHTAGRPGRLRRDPPLRPRRARREVDRRAYRPGA